MKKTKIINIFGVPGVGKSTTAARLYSQMKASGYSVELVREHAKDWAWESREIGPFNQIAVLGEQIKREARLYGKVDYIITDSPLLLAHLYMQHNHQSNCLKNIINDVRRYTSSRHDITELNFYIEPGEKYDPNGRFENQEDLAELNGKLKEMLLSEGYRVIFEEPSIQKINDNGIIVTESSDSIKKRISHMIDMGYYSMLEEDDE